MDYPKDKIPFKYILYIQLYSILSIYVATVFPAQNTKLRLAWNPLSSAI